MVKNDSEALHPRASVIIRGSNDVFSVVGRLIGDDSPYRPGSD